MALDYHKCAQEIADNIGGGSNVVSAAHCATRLRLVIADNGKVNKEALENVDGVKGMFESNGQLQLIIGTGTVNKVYDEFLAITGASAASKEEVKAAATAKQPLYISLLKPIGDVFVQATGKIEHGDRGDQLICSKIEALELNERTNRPKVFEVYIPSRMLSMDRMETLQSIFDRYNGLDHIELMVESSCGDMMRMELPTKVDAKNMVLLAEVKDFVGRDGHVQIA